MRRMPVKTMFLLVEAGAAISMLALSFLLSAMTGQGWVLLAGSLLTACALFWMFLLTLFFAKRLSQFTSDLCQTMDSMISGGEEPARAEDRETIFARISYRLSRLYNILQENRRRVDEERRELQTLVSDISLTCRLAARDDILLKCDASKLQRVFDNLLRNAVNYSYDGTEITIEAKHSGDSVTLKLSNCGGTIPREKLERIFEQFYRLDTGRGSSGNGLGLAIAKQIITLHKGTITVESGDGLTVFTVTLPILQQKGNLETTRG